MYGRRLVCCCALVVYVVCLVLDFVAYCGLVFGCLTCLIFVLCFRYLCFVVC